MKNRQSLRSRKMMQDALQDLIKRKEFQKITITELCHQANLSRRTFYDHFETKDELLTSLIEDLMVPIFQELTASDATLIDIQGESAITNLFKLWKKNEDIFKMIRKTNCGSLLENWFNDWFLRVYQNSSLANESDISDLQSGYINQIVSSAYFAVLTYWLDTGMQHSPELMGEFTNSILGIKPIGKQRLAFIDKFNDE